MGIFPDLDIQLFFPAEIHVNLMPPVPQKLLVPARAGIALKYRGMQDLTLVVANSCEVFDWEVRNSAGQVIDGDKDDLCLQVMQTLTLHPGDHIRRDTTALLNGKSLQSGGTYSFRLHYFRQIQAEQQFSVRVLQ